MWNRGGLHITTRRITLNIPEKVLLAEKTDEASFAHELQVLAAVKLEELAGTPRVEFLLSLSRYSVFPFQAELNDLKGGNA